MSLLMIDPLYFPAIGGAIFGVYHGITVYRHSKHVKKLESDITRLMDECAKHVDMISSLDSALYRLKQNKSDDLRAFIHDLTIDSAMVSITRINPENIFLHNRDKR